MLKSYKAYLVIASALILGGSSLAFTVNEGDGSKYFSIIKNFQLFEKIYRSVGDYYVDNVEPAQLMREGLDAMLKELDPYTNYISEGQIEGYRMNQAAATGDIGVELMEHGKDIVIKEVYEGLPGHEGGLKAGDILKAINGDAASGRSLDDVKRVLQGQAGTALTLSIQPVGKSSTEKVTLTRDLKQATSVPHYDLVTEDGIAYVKLQTFMKPGCTGEVKAALEDMQQRLDGKDVKGVIFDLRQNGGGLLRESITMVNLFVPPGELVVGTKGRTEEWNKEYKTLAEAFMPDVPLTVLVDDRSASASEIFSGSMQDLDRGVIIGRQSFGKGLVQQTRDIGFNSKLKLTVAKYYLNSGRCVQAIDYSGRYKDGISTTPDSLLTAFKTTTGRTVYDGSGVRPDVKVDKAANSKAIQSLIDNHLIFDFATQYRQQKEDIGAAKDFSLSDADFAEFTKFANSKGFSFETKTEAVIERLRASTEDEKYKDAASNHLDRLTELIKKEKTGDLERYKSAITRLLEEEIVSRYHLQKGKVEVNMDNDPDINEAIAVINDSARYAKILKGQ